MRFRRRIVVARAVVRLLFVLAFWCPIVLILHCISAFSGIAIGLVWVVMTPERRADEWLRALDQFWNVVAFGGEARESISSNVGRQIRLGRVAWRGRLVILLTPHGHCEDANKNEQPIVDLIERLR